MKKQRFTENQIIRMIKELEAGKSVSDLSREHGVSSTTLYNWRKRYSGMDATQLRQFKELQEEKRRLKQMYADLSLDNRILKEIVEKKL